MSLYELERALERITGDGPIAQARRRAILAMIAECEEK